MLNEHFLSGQFSHSKKQETNLCAINFSMPMWFIVLRHRFRRHFAGMGSSPQPVEYDFSYMYVYLGRFASRSSFIRISLNYIQYMISQSSTHPLIPSPIWHVVCLLFQEIQLIKTKFNWISPTKRICQLFLNDGDDSADRHCSPLTRTLRTQLKFVQIPLERVHTNTYQFHAHTQTHICPEQCFALDHRKQHHSHL